MDAQLLVGAGVVVLLLIVYISSYNGLINARQKTNEARSGIGVQLKRRCDVIPNLINCVQGYVAHEKSIMENISKLRAEAIALPLEDKSMKQRSAIEEGITANIRSLFAVSENYPQLRASENFLYLQQTLAKIEKELAASRRIYNNNTAYLNTKIQQFPSCVVASVHKITGADFFEFGDGEKDLRLPPEVKFN